MQNETVSIILIRGNEYVATLDEGVKNHPQMVGKLVELSRVPASGKAYNAQPVWRMA